MEKPASVQPWWRRPQARWAAGVVVVLMLTLVCGLAWIVYRGSVQRNAVAMIRRSGGYAFHDWELREGRYDPEHVLWQVSIVERDRQPPWPTWIVAILGVDALSEVKMVHLGPNDPDAVMVHVGGLRSVEEVTFDEKSPLTDAGMAHLRGLTELKVLMLPNGRMTGKALANLSGLAKLQSLSIKGISLQSDDLEPLRHLTELKDLIIVNAPSAPCNLRGLRDLERLQIMSLTKIVIHDLEPIRRLPHLLSLQLVDSELDDAGLAPLGEPGSLPELVGLYLKNTRITVAGLKTLRKLKRVSSLELEGTRITDAGFDDLCALRGMGGTLSLAGTGITDEKLGVLADKLPAVKGLDVASTQITDVGLKHLSRLRYLNELNLTKTRVTDAGVDAFVKLHPLVKIIR